MLFLLNTERYRLLIGQLSAVVMLFLFVVVVPPVLASDYALKSRLGCVPFVASNIEAMAFTEHLTTVLLNELERTGAFEVAERKRLEAAMDLEGIRSDLLGQEQLQRLGTRLGVDYLVSGKVNSQPQGMLIDVTVLNLRGQRVILTEKLRINESDLTRSLQELSSRIREAAKGNVVAQSGPVSAKPLASATGLEASGSTNAIRLRWSHPEPSRIVGYVVLRGAGPQGPFNTVSTVTVPAYVDDQLRLNETYYYRVAAVGQGGVTSEPSAPVQGATSVAPAVPIFMNVEPILGGAVLSWRQRPVAGGDERIQPKGVRIYRRSSAEKELLPVARVSDEAPVFRDQGLADGTTYIYSMTAFNQAGAESEQSVQLSVTTPPVTSGLSATAEKVRRIPLVWQVHPFAGVNGYRIQRASSKEGPYQEIAAINDRSQNSYPDTGLTDKTTYWYRIIATSKEHGTGGASGAVSAMTRDVPPAPVKLTAGHGEPRRVTLSWESNAAPDDEIKGFYLYRGETGQEKRVRIAELSADKRSYRDAEEPLKDAASYSYMIVAYNAGGAVSPQSAGATAVTKAVPKTPQGVTAASGEPRRVTVRWQKNPEPDIAEYIIFRQHGDADFKQLKRTQETLLVDTELKDGAIYQYRVQALDRDGLESGQSSVAKAVTKSVPSPVQGLQLKDKAARVVAWQKSSQQDVKRYNIYKKGFLGGQKVTSIEGTEWKIPEPGKLELYLTAEDADGLESEPSVILMVE